MTPAETRRWAIDASALLAHLLAEEGGERVREALANDGAVMSAVNWAETLTKFAAEGHDPDEVAKRLLSDSLLSDALEIVPLTADDGSRIARLRPLTRHLGLSIADRACLSLAGRLTMPVLTTDRAWSELNIDVDVHVAR